MLTATHTFPTDLGWMTLSWTADRLTRLTFGHPSAAAAIASLEADDGWTSSDAQSVVRGSPDLASVVRGSPDPALPAWIADLAARLQSYAAGSNERFDDVPLDLSHLSAFQARVVRACRKIGRGKVRSYGDLAAAAGSPGAARAVGSVMAKNRYPIIIPCHRVVGSAGTIGGFSARDGINMKWRMLELEGAKIKKPQRAPRTQRMSRASV